MISTLYNLHSVIIIILLIFFGHTKVSIVDNVSTIRVIALQICNEYIPVMKRIHIHYILEYGGLAGK